MVFVAVDERLGFGERFGGDAGLHPDLGGDTSEEDTVIAGVGEDLGGNLAVRQSADRTGNMGASVYIDVDESLPELAQSFESRPGTNGPLLAGESFVVRDAFSLIAGIDPACGDSSEIYDE